MSTNDLHMKALEMEGFKPVTGIFQSALAIQKHKAVFQETYEKAGDDFLRGLAWSIVERERLNVEQTPKRVKVFKKSRKKTTEVTDADPVNAVFRCRLLLG